MGLGTDLLPNPSVDRSGCQSVGPEDVLWQNGWLDLEAVWDGEWSQSKDGCIWWGWRSL